MTNENQNMKHLHKVIPFNIKYISDTIIKINVVISSVMYNCNRQTFPQQYHMITLF